MPPRCDVAHSAGTNGSQGAHSAAGWTLLSAKDTQRQLQIPRTFSPLARLRTARNDKSKRSTRVQCGFALPYSLPVYVPVFIACGGEIIPASAVPLGVP